MRKFNKTQVFFLIGAVLFTALFLFSGIMAMRQYKDTNLRGGRHRRGRNRHSGKL